MTYFCFIESAILSVPHMEPLMADDLDAAKTEAETLLAQHAMVGFGPKHQAGEQTLRLSSPDSCHAPGPDIIPSPETRHSGF